METNWNQFKALLDAKRLMTARGPRDCPLLKYSRLEEIPEFMIRGKITAFATPDSTYSVTKEAFDNAHSSILIGIYDFTSIPVRDLLIDARSRNVAVTLMLDINSTIEKNILRKLEEAGVKTVEAPSCLNDQVKYFPSCHEKVIVIDDQLTFIQSGNYTKHSIPVDQEIGHRDMGVLIEDKALAAFFTGILQGDMALKPRELVEKASLRFFQESAVFKVPKPVKPPQLFDSGEFDEPDPIRVQPVLSPDNYMEQVMDLLRGAKKSIVIEQQYIWTDNAEVKKLLKAIKEAQEAAENDFSVQIIVAPPFVSTPDDWKDLEKDVKVLENMGCEVRLLTKKHFTHCHNKLIIIDDEIVLISSQNWSNKAVSLNREAGVIIYHKGITTYFKEIFDLDWRVSEPDRENEKANIVANLVAERVFTKITQLNDMTEVDLSDVEQF